MKSATDQLLPGHIGVLEAAKRLGCHPSTIYKRIRCGEIEAIKLFGWMWMIPVAGIHQLGGDNERQ